MAAADLAYRDLAVALAVGLLIGIERGWRQRGITTGGRVAGVRTFAVPGGCHHFGWRDRDLFLARGD
jgi:uncharacterized membrane protein YhiD involved in acid resistance